MLSETCSHSVKHSLASCPTPGKVYPMTSIPAVWILGYRVNTESDKVSRPQSFQCDQCCGGCSVINVAMDVLGMTPKQNSIDLPEM